MSGILKNAFFFSLLMGIFDRLFKKHEKETLSFSEIGGWIARKEQEETPLTARLQQLIRELEEHVSVLENVDIDQKHSHPGMKSVSRGNLQKYITHVKLLLKNLSSSSDINTALLDFARKSENNYQKATLLVGEVGEVKKSIVNFGKFVSRNKHVITLPLFYASMKEKLLLVESYSSDIAAVRGEITALGRKVASAEKKEVELQATIARKKAAFLKEKEAYEAAETVRRKDLHKVKTLIDFKALSALFHASKEMAIVRSLKENFDVSDELLPLLEEAKMVTPEIKRLIKKIKGEVLTPPSEPIFTIPTNMFSQEKATAEKRLEKLLTKKEELVASIKDEFEKVDVVIE